MPFKSLKQAKYMHWAQQNGKLPKSVDLKEWDKSTDFKDLPKTATKFKKLNGMMGKK